MRNYYRTIRNYIIEAIKKSPLNSLAAIHEENSGLHFLLELNTTFSDASLVENAKKEGIRISCLSEYYHSPDKCMSHTFLLNYSGIRRNDIDEAIRRLALSVCIPE
jgi:GntR family transcriptional regulator/MocR family aminotransferase